MHDRDKKLDTSLLQCGKYQESVTSLLDWIHETQDMVSNQRAPSADYKVAKAQLQEQKVSQNFTAVRICLCSVGVYMCARAGVCV